MCPYPWCERITSQQACSFYHCIVQLWFLFSVALFHALSILRNSVERYESEYGLLRHFVRLLLILTTVDYVEANVHHSRIVNLAVGVFMILGGTAQFFPNFAV